MTQVSEDEDIPPLPPPVSPLSQSLPGDDVVLQAVSGGSQQPASRFKKRKLFQQNKGSRKRAKKEVKISLSAGEVAHLENGEMLNDTHITVANQLLRKQFPDIRGLQSSLLGESLSFAERLLFKL